MSQGLGRILPGRLDAPQTKTTAEASEVPEPIADGFRNDRKARESVSVEELRADKSQRLTLTPPEMPLPLCHIHLVSTDIRIDEAWSLHRSSWPARQVGGTRNPGSCLPDVSVAGA